MGIMPIDTLVSYKIPFFTRDIKLLYSIRYMYEISNSIAMECLSCTLINAIAIGYKLAYYSENLYISILEHQHDLKYCLQHVKPEPLSIERQLLI